MEGIVKISLVIRGISLSHLKNKMMRALGSKSWVVCKDCALTLSHDLLMCQNQRDQSDHLGMGECRSRSG